MGNQQLSKTETITLAGGCFWVTEVVSKTFSRNVLAIHTFSLGMNGFFCLLF